MDSTLSVRDIYKFLESQNALIVHFSGAPPMPSTGNPSQLHYPEDLQNVMNEGAMGGICRSAVRPGDTFGYGTVHACGCVGVVIGLKGEHSLLGVCTDDLGTFCDAQGVRQVPDPKVVTLTDLEWTFSERESWNEWVVRDYTVLGLFLVKPYVVWKDSAELEIEPAVIRSTFTGHRYFTFQGNNIHKFEGEKLLTIHHSEIYVA